MLGWWVAVLVLLVTVPLLLLAGAENARWWRLPPDWPPRGEGELLALRQSASLGWFAPTVVGCLFMGLVAVALLDPWAIIPALALAMTPLWWGSAFPSRAAMRIEDRTLVVQGWFGRVCPRPATHRRRLDQVTVEVGNGLLGTAGNTELVVHSPGGALVLGHLRTAPEVLEAVCKRVRRLQQDLGDDDALLKQQARIREIDDPFSEGMLFDQLGAAERMARALLPLCLLLAVAAAGAVAMWSSPLWMALPGVPAAVVLSWSTTLMRRVDTLRIAFTASQLQLEGWVGGLWLRQRTVALPVAGLQLAWLSTGYTKEGPVYTVVLTPERGRAVTLQAVRCEEAALQQLAARLSAVQELAAERMGRGEREVPERLRQMAERERNPD